MMASDANRCAVLRVALAAVVAADLLSFFFFVGTARTNAVAEGIALHPFVEVLSRTIACGAIVFIGIVAAVSFGRRPGHLWPGGIALAALMVLSSLHTQLFGSPWRHLFFSGVTLTGWLLGLAVGRWQGTPDDESYAHTGCVALIGAAYLNSGISKLVFGGLEWLHGASIQAIVIVQDGMVRGGLLGGYRSWIVGAPAVSAAFAVATVVFELAGPLLLAGRWVRRGVALGLLGMHANIFLATGIVYWESMVFLLLFGFWGPDPVPRREPGAVPRPLDRRFAGAVALLAICGAAAIAHQERRFVRRSAERVAVLPPPAPVELPPAPKPMWHNVGPFAVGETLADRWSIETLTITDNGFLATLAGPPGRTAFDVTCSAAGHSSPFDVGAARVMYSSKLPFGELAAVGRAFQERMRNAAGGQDICARLADWRLSARAEPPR